MGRLFLVVWAVAVAGGAGCRAGGDDPAQRSVRALLPNTPLDFEGKLEVEDVSQYRPFFGNAFELQGDELLVGAFGFVDPYGITRGAVLVYRRGPSGWLLTETVLQRGSAWGAFGHSLAVDGDRLAVGVQFQETPEGIRSGAVHVHARTAAGWVREAILYPSDPQYNGYFGQSLAIEGDRIAVGAGIGAGDVSRAAVYIFRKVDGAWLEEVKLVPDSAGESVFGTSIDLEGDLLAIAAPTYGSEPKAGFVYLYRHGAGGWAREAKLTTDRLGLLNSNSFGGFVRLRDGVVYTSMRQVPTDTETRYGAVLIFERQAGVWAERQQIFAPKVAGRMFPYGSFGGSFALDGDRLAVIESNDRMFGPDRVWLFSRSGDGWVESALIENGANENIFRVDLAGQNLVAAISVERGRLRYRVALPPTLVPPDGGPADASPPPDATTGVVPPPPPPDAPADAPLPTDAPTGTPDADEPGDGGPPPADAATDGAADGAPADGAVDGAAADAALDRAAADGALADVPPGSDAAGEPLPTVDCTCALGARSARAPATQTAGAVLWLLGVAAAAARRARRRGPR